MFLWKQTDNDVYTTNTGKITGIISKFNDACWTCIVLNNTGAFNDDTLHMKIHHDRESATSDVEDRLLARMTCADIVRMVDNHGIDR